MPNKNPLAQPVKIPKNVLMILHKAKTSNSVSQAKGFGPQLVAPQFRAMRF